MRSVGLLPDEPLDVGHLKRCRVDGDREKRGWYHLHELRLDSGDFVIVGSFGVWRGIDPGTTRVELGKAATMSPEQRAALKARLAAPHERLTDLAVVPRERPHPGAAAREQPRDPWKAELLWQLYAATSNYLASSLDEE